jgi:hypothetical protein
MTEEKIRLVKQGDGGAGTEGRAGYTPLKEGYTPNDEQDSLPQAPPGGSGEKDQKKED